MKTLLQGFVICMEIKLCVKNIIRLFGIMIFILLMSVNSFSAAYTVNSASTFAAAQTSAAAGDTIVWTNGTYSDINLTFSKNGITLKAEAPGGVIFTGNSNITISASGITFADFQFNGCNVATSPYECIIITGSRNLLTGINLANNTAVRYIEITSTAQYTEIYNCNFQNKSIDRVGNMIGIAENAAMPNYTKIRYCSFQHSPGPGGDYGNEPIRIGFKGNCISRCVIEYCYFTDLGGADNETISIKSLQNVVRYCTFDNNPTGEVSLRHGGENQIYGNFFINNSHGVVIKEGDGNVIVNNYFATSSSREPIYMNVGSPLYSVVPNNTVILHNTFYNCKASNVTNAAPTNTKFINNIFYNSPVNGVNANVSYTGNIISGSFGITVPAGNTTANPLLSLNSDGYYCIGAGGPAIDAADDSYTNIPDIANLDEDYSLSLDISGKARPAVKKMKDVGCSEYNAAGTITNRPLKISDVGPSYLRGSATGVPDRSENSHQAGPSGFILYDAYPNPFNPSTTFGYSLLMNSWVNLSIYNILGQQIAELANSEQSAGSYSLTWNADAASGVYFYRMEAVSQNDPGERFVDVRKMILSR